MRAIASIMRMMAAHRFLKTAVSIFIALIILSFVQLQSIASKERTCRIALQNTKGNAVYLNVEIADNEFRRRKGLMFRKSLPSNEGMLFVFEYDQKLSFWMKNTYIPLSVAFIDASGIIREVYDMVPLNEHIIYSSKHSVRYALEVNKGWFDGNNIAPGCRVFFHGCIGK